MGLIKGQHQCGFDTDPKHSMTQITETSYLIENSSSYHIFKTELSSFSLASGTARGFYLLSIFISVASVEMFGLCAIN